MFIQYKYKMQKRPDGPLWPRDGNLGDAIQNLAVENIYKKAGISENSLCKVNRDELKTYNGKDVKLVMQSWFGDYADVFPLPWSEKITPIFIGFHLSTINNTRDRFIKEKIYEQMKQYEPIGCRDRNTRDFLISLGVKAYFSGCMTLTFDKRKKEPQKGKIFLVDLTPDAEQVIPEEIKQEADRTISHFYYWNEYPVNKQGAQEFEDYARKILQRYKNEAKLVITSKIHSAMPCVAMGIPVIFINEDSKNERFDVLNGILPVYTPKDNRYIDWNPKATNIDQLKNAIMNNAVAQITGTNKDTALQNLIDCTDKLKPINFRQKVLNKPIRSKHHSFWWHLKHMNF